MNKRVSLQFRRDIVPGLHGVNRVPLGRLRSRHCRTSWPADSRAASRQGRASLRFGTCIVRWALSQRANKTGQRGRPIPTGDEPRRRGYFAPSSGCIFWTTANRFSTSTLHAGGYGQTCCAQGSAAQAAGSTHSHSHTGWVSCDYSGSSERGSCLPCWMRAPQSRFGHTRCRGGAGRHRGAQCSVMLWGQMHR